MPTSVFQWRYLLYDTMDFSAHFKLSLKTRSIYKQECEQYLLSILSFAIYAMTLAQILPSICGTDELNGCDSTFMTLKILADDAQINLLNDRKKVELFYHLDSTDKSNRITNLVQQ